MPLLDARQTEREFNHQRQAEGIAAARAKSIRLGRPPQARPEAIGWLCETWRNQEISARCAAKQLCVTPRTFLLWRAKAWARKKIREAAPGFQQKLDIKACFFTHPCLAYTTRRRMAIHPFAYKKQIEYCAQFNEIAYNILLKVILQEI
jgi:hypothetical protein